LSDLLPSPQRQSTTGCQLNKKNYSTSFLDFSFRNVFACVFAGVSLSPQRSHMCTAEAEEFDRGGTCHSQNLPCNI